MRYIKSFLIFCALFFCLAACSYPGLFAGIESEVKLKDPSVISTTEHLCYDGTYEFVSNGTIFMKEAGKRTWDAVPLPDSGAFREIGLTGGYLWAINFDSASMEFKGLYYTDTADIENWREAGWEVQKGTPYRILETQGNSSIYLLTRERAGNNYTYRIYRVTGSVLETSPVFEIRSSGSNENNDSTRPLAVAESGTDFLVLTKANLYKNSTVLSENGNFIALAKGDGSNVYVMNKSGGIRLYNGTVLGGVNNFDFTPSANSPKSLAFVSGDSGIKGAENGMLLVGCGSGYREIILGTDGAVPSSFQEPGASGTSTILTSKKSQYSSSIGYYPVHCVFPVVMAGTTYKYRVYALVMDSGDTCLWSYYPDDADPSWNRD